jgi:hypothetical protein
MISFVETLRFLAIFGDIGFILWMTYNAIDEGFKGTIYQQLSYIGLTSVLLLNIYLLSRKAKFG